MSVRASARVEFLLALVHKLDHLAVGPGETCNQCVALRRDVEAVDA